MKRYKRILFITIVVLSALTVLSHNIEAAVIAVKSPTGNKESIYVAGNPDFFPVEYYDESDDAYKGVMPLLLERISESMGTDFVYVSTGKADKRRQLASNGQVELVSAIIKDKVQSMIEAVDYYIVPFRFDTDEGSFEVCFGFTSIATEDFRISFEAALASISEDEILQMVLSQSIGPSVRHTSRKLFIIMSFIALGALLALSVIGYLLYQKRKSLHLAKCTDETTGLGNKTYFIEKFNEIIEAVERPIYAIVYIGFDIAKVNNHYSYGEAQEQLCFTAKELKDLEKDSDIVARVGGGSFAIAHICQESEIEYWIIQLLGRLNRYCEKFGRNYRPEYHAGVYLLKKTDYDAETVIENARIGYQYAVHNGISYQFSTDVFLKKQSEDDQLLKYTTAAVENGEILVYIQLVTDALGEVIGGEVLSRWQHPRRGLLLPSTFIPVMESEGTVIELDYYIFEQTCKLLEKWKNKGYDYSLSCNFNRTSISNDQFILRIQDIISRYRFDYSNLVIEITENTMYVNKEMAFANMLKCKSLGFQIGLDDVGSGYTSFSDLKEFPADVLKIDRSIVTGATNAKGIALLKGIITLAHNLGMLVQCEGIETEHQYLLLKSMNCDFFQGYYFYKQMPVEEVEKILI